MKRLLLTLICFTPLLFSPSVSFSLELVGPNGEKALSNEQYGPISSVETLWGVATKLRPDNSVSIQQTLVAIYKLNPYAFEQGNVNKLIPESVIEVPRLDFITQQTDNEATALLNKYSTKKQPKKQPKKQQPKATVVKPVKNIEEVANNEGGADSIASQLVAEAEQAVKAENLVDKQELLTLQSNIKSLEEELNSSNEQLIVATEMNQAIKQKLQPLQDELQLLKEQLESDILLQQELQKTIEDYKAQLDATPLPPFSGEGLLNKILRTISSSMTNLLVTIFAPLLLLLSLFVLVMRIRSKRELDIQEQELAESTAILMEESGQFDALLTEDFSEDELDFASTEAESAPVAKEDAPVNSADAQELTLPESSASDDLDILQENSSDVIDLTLDEEPEAVEHSEDDPFGIEGLAEESLATSIELDEPEDEDDPFGIGALEEDELVVAVELDDAEDEDDPFGIGALEEEPEQEDLIASVDLESEEKVVSAAEQADLDLAAAWESQLSEQAGDDELKQNDATEQDKSEDDLTVASQEESTLNDIEAEVNELDVSDNVDLSEFLVEPEEAELDISGDDEIDALLSQQSSENAVQAVDVADDADIDDLLAQVSNEDVTEEPVELELDVADVADIDDLLSQASNSNVIEEPVELALDVADDADIDGLLEQVTNEDVIEEPAELELDVADDADIDGLLEQVINEEATEAPVELELDVADDADIDSLLEQVTNEDVTEEPAELELDVTDDAELDDLLEQVTNEEATEEPVELELDVAGDAGDIDDLLTQVSNEDVTEEPAELELDVFNEAFNANDLDALQNDIQSENSDVSKHDLLAKQLSDVAFNEEAPLPKVEKERVNDFIDIETLLENSDEAGKDEVYSELELDLGLDEFPDVINSDDSIDIDDDENGIGAQLDLARAYLEIDDKAGAKDILLAVKEKSNVSQLAEIEKLLSRL